MKRWTDEDVEQLVKMAGNVVNWLDIGQSINPTLSMHRSLEVALKPFRPDPDQPLIDLITDLRGQSGYQDNAAIIAAVRAHDAKHGGQS